MEDSDSEGGRLRTDVRGQRSVGSQTFLPAADPPEADDFPERVCGFVSSEVSEFDFIAGQKLIFTNNE
jgi:hypothetical protein